MTNNHLRAVPYPSDSALRIQKAFNAWVSLYEEYREGQHKYSRHRNFYLSRIDHLFTEYIALERKYSTVAA